MNLQQLPADHAETKMLQLGIDRHARHQARLVKRAAEERADYSGVIRNHVLKLADLIAEAVAANGAAGRPNERVALLGALNPATTAYVALAAVFSVIHNERDRAKIANRIGKRIEDELHFGTIEQQQPALWKRLRRYADDRISYVAKKTFVTTVAAKEGVVVEEWDAATRGMVGLVLLALVEKAGIVVSSAVGKARGNTEIRVDLSNDVTEWLDEHRRRAGVGDLPMIAPIYAPSRTAPVDWTGLRRGGYAHLTLPLVKGSSSTLPQGALRDADLRTVYDAVNTMQRTPWRVNADMLRVVEFYWKLGHGVGKLPPCSRAAKPERLPDAEWLAMDEEERKARRIAIRELHAANRQAASDLVAVNQVLDQARDLADAPECFMVYQLDYRGRVYAAPLLSPQGPDYVKALLEFSNGKPVGDRGATWVALQLASLWDGEWNGKKLSKCSFADRYAWVEENEELFRSVVADPISDTRWHKADKPFMFLRTAVDHVAVLDHGDDFVSHLPIALDGSCSGVQHYAALLRDPSSARSVNLVASEAPADLYTEIGETVKEMVEADDPSAAREFWLNFGISRKVTKKPVMTYGYSSREPGFTEWYELNFVRPALKAADRRDEKSNPIARYLAKKTLAAVEDRLVGVSEAMAWLMHCAELLASEGKGVSWVAPSGLPIHQWNFKSNAVRIETLLQGERLRLTVPGTERTISKSKQKSAIAPNHTHSLDASHLMFTVLHAAAEYGLTDFCLIHDSFGAHAADTDALFSAVREAFVWMYETFDPLQHLYERTLDALSEDARAKLMPPPQKGPLDIREVLQSLYAFA